MVWCNPRCSNGNVEKVKHLGHSGQQGVQQDPNWGYIRQNHLNYNLENPNLLK